MRLLMHSISSVATVVAFVVLDVAAQVWQSCTLQAFAICVGLLLGMVLSLLVRLWALTYLPVILCVLVILSASHVSSLYGSDAHWMVSAAIWGIFFAVPVGVGICLTLLLSRTLAPRRAINSKGG